jgi:hypothetical protein
MIVELKEIEYKENDNQILDCTEEINKFIDKIIEEQ